MFEPPANSVQTGLIWQRNYLIGCLRAQTLAAIECGRINYSLGGSSVQAPGQLYTSWTCYKTTGTIPAAIECGLCLAWKTRWIKKWWHLRTANWTCHRQSPDSIEQCIYLEFLRALAQFCAAITMYYCRWCWLAAIQKRMRIRLPLLGGNSGFWILVMVVPTMWKFWGCQKICGCYEWEFTVNSRPRTDKY